MEPYYTIMRLPGESKEEFVLLLPFTPNPILLYNTAVLIALALTSHLPHLAASALAGILPDEFFDLAATGFRDTTRIASGDATIWTGIFQQNREAVLQAMKRYSERLAEFQRALENDDKDALDSLLKQGKKVRDALGS